MSGWNAAGASSTLQEELTYNKVYLTKLALQQCRAVPQSAYCCQSSSLNYEFQYINGGSLEQLIQLREEELPWSVRMSLALDMAKGIAYLHSRGLFHRDLTSKVREVVSNYMSEHQLRQLPIPERAREAVGPECLHRRGWGFRPRR